MKFLKLKYSKCFAIPEQGRIWHSCRYYSAGTTGGYVAEPGAGAGLQPVSPEMGPVPVAACSAFNRATVETV